jgi:hypothetical protein
MCSSCIILQQAQRPIYILRLAHCQHDPELSHCAEIKNEMLAAIEKRRAGGNKAQVAPKSETLKPIVSRLSWRVKSVTSRLSAAELDDEVAGIMEHVLL